MRHCEFIEMLGRVVQQLYEPLYTAASDQLVTDSFSFVDYLEFTILTVIEKVLGKRGYVLDST